MTTSLFYFCLIMAFVLGYGASHFLTKRRAGLNKKKRAQ